MIETTIKQMHELVINMQNSIKLDIEDIKAADMKNIRTK